MSTAPTKDSLVARLRERAGKYDEYGWLARNDLYFLLRYLLNRKDADRQWILEAAERIEELERELVKIIEEMS